MFVAKHFKEIGILPSRDARKLNRVEIPLFEFSSGCCACFATDAFGFCVEDPWVDVRSVAAFYRIAFVMDPLGQIFSYYIDPKPYDLMNVLCRERPNDVAVMAWEVLMYEEESHYLGSLN